MHILYEINYYNVRSFDGWFRILQTRSNAITKLTAHVSPTCKSRRMTQMPAYSQVDEALFSGGSAVCAAECHGVLCGILCASGTSDMQRWVRHLFEAPATDREITAGSLRLLHDVHQCTLTEINHETLEFTMLIPEPTEPMDIRISGLADWCSGFGLGLIMGGLNDQMLVSDDVREFVEDVQYISDASFVEEDNNPDQLEKSFTEIEEYVRMGVLLINEELQPISQKPTIH